MSNSFSSPDPSAVPELPEGAEIPKLSPDATPEEKDLHWFKYVYRGDKMPQLTVRAVVIGGLLGAVMSVSNLYTTMKVGWSFGVAITACVMSFVIWNVVRIVSMGRVSQMSLLENNCMQSTASAAGYSTGATIATCFGALLILEGKHQPWVIVLLFTLLTGAMGVFLAIPMKRQMINQEQLPFPSGIAAATTLQSFYSQGVEAMRKAYALVISMGIGAIVGLMTSPEAMPGDKDSEPVSRAFHTVYQWFRDHLGIDVHLPDQIPEKGIFKYHEGQLVGGGMATENGHTVWKTALESTPGKTVQFFGLECSVLLIAAGMITGLRVSLSMFVVSAALYFGVAPWLSGIDAQHAADAGYVLNIPLRGGGAEFAPTRWALWGGTAVMVFASLTALALQWKTIARSFRLFKSSESHTTPEGDIEERMAAIEVPGSWMVIGMVPIAIGMILLQVIAFNISWWAGAIAVAMSFVLSLVASRATGETDTTPIGAMGKVMQLLFAVLSPKNVTHNLISAGIGANSGSSSADLLTDLKSGYLLGANPRKQFLAQFMGIFFGTLVVVPAWFLMIPDTTALEKYPLPATQAWVAVARVLSQGVETLPPSARMAIVIGALIGVTLPILEKINPKMRAFLPSAMGLGLGWVVGFNNALSFVIGAIIGSIWMRLGSKNYERYNFPIASGLVAGESLLKALVAIVTSAIGLLSSGKPPVP